MVQVIIVDDEILARIGIQSLLDNAEDIQVVGSFGLARDALEFMKTSLVDIVITDIEMPEMNGLEFIKKIFCFLPDLTNLNMQKKLFLWGLMDTY